jgi:hypothetical protein
MSKSKHMWRKMRSVNKEPNRGNKISWQANLNSSSIYKIFATIIPHDAIKFMHCNRNTFLQCVLNCIRRAPIQNKRPICVIIPSREQTSHRRNECDLYCSAGQDIVTSSELYSNWHTWGLSTASSPKKNEYLSHKLLLILFFLFLFLGLFCFPNYLHIYPHYFHIFSAHST